jgi:uncharacterized cupin superfamily protein
LWVIFNGGSADYVVLNKVMTSKLKLFRDLPNTWEDASPAPEKIIKGAPIGYANEVVNGGDSGKLYCGIWRAEIGAWRVSYSEWEYCYITKGRAKITENGGAEFEVCAGDAFTIDAGFEGVWEVLEPMEKHYVILL